jgi:hypothetical protein
VERERILTRFRPTEWRSWVAAIAVMTLLLQAALASLTPRDATAAIDRLAARALCVGSGPQPDRKSPAPPPHRADHGCCILCTVPALDAGAGDPGTVQTPTWGPSLAAPLRGREAEDASPPSERSPIRARAPPSA